MAISKVIYGGNTLIDLTQDTVEASKLLSGYKAHGADGEAITGTCDYDVNSSGATAKATEILAGKKAAVKGSVLTGTMKNNGAVNGTIAVKDGEYTVPQGYHDGSGKVSILAAEQAKLVAKNIREGITILGVLGTMSGSEDEKKQGKTVTPTFAEQTILPDAAYTCLSQVKVAAIPVAYSDNAAGGQTVTIG